MKLLIHALVVLSDSLCEPGTCSGNHHINYLCGGASAFLLERTSGFTDFDLFVSCDGKIKPHTGDFYTVTLSPSEYVVNIDVPHFRRVQIIRVPSFHKSLGVKPDEMNAPYVRDLFGLYVLFSFDLPICRMAIAGHSGVDSCRVLDLSSIPFTRGPVDEARVKKYLERLSIGVPLHINNNIRFMFFKMIETETSASLLDLADRLDYALTI